jgi:hypothetical protein
MNNALCASELAAAQSKSAGELSPVTDKKGFGARWGFSVRHVDNFLAAGMPHLRVGSRRVRILVDEADLWMREKYGTRRNGKLAVGKA